MVMMLWRLRLLRLIARTPLIGRRLRRADEVRVAAFRSLLAGQAPSRSELIAATGLSEEEVLRELRSLSQRGQVVVDGDTVIGAAGLTARSSGHELVVDGRRLHTWCAYDLVGISAAMKADAVARTVCAHCAAPIEVRLERGAPPLDSEVLGWLPRTRRGVHDFCPMANFFCSPAHLAAWRSEHGRPRGRASTLTELAARGVWAWGPAVNAGTQV